MNLRTTTFLFALLLTTLWIFGFMIAQRKKEADLTAIVPSMQKGDVKIDKVVLNQTGGVDKDAVSLEFVNIKDHWFYTDGKQQLRVEDFHIKGMIDAVKDARADESADLSKELSFYKLKPPLLTVTLTGKLKDDDKTWTFYVGKESPEQPTPQFYYVNSSERDQKAFATARRPLEKLFVKDVNTLRSKRLFDFIESGVTGVNIVKGDKKLDIKRGEGNLWVAVEPKGLGFLGFDSGAPEDKMPKDDIHGKMPPKKVDEPISGVKSLLGTIIKVTVDDAKDFVNIGADHTALQVDPKNAPMKIEITTTGDAKDPVKETLLIGKKVDGKDYYYARLGGDDGVFMLPAKTIEPIDQAVTDPGKLRSLDISVMDPKKLDYMVLKSGKDDFKFVLLDRAKNWDLYIGKEKKKTNDEAVEKMAEHLLGKKAIVEYLDFAEVDKDKKLAEWGLKDPATEIAAYAGALDIAKKDDDKKDDKDKKDKKEEDKNKMPDLKKDVKPELKLAFGKIEKDLVYVHRTLADGTASYFKVKKDFLDKIVPAEGIELAYLDTALPDLAFHNILAIKIDRKTDKGTETVELERHAGVKDDVWYLKDPLEPTGVKLAETKHVFDLRKHVMNLKAKKWIKKLDDNEDLGKYGLKTPAVTMTLRVEKNAEDMASMTGAFAGVMNPTPLAAICAAMARHQHTGATETVVIQFGSEAVEEKEPEKEKEKDKDKNKEKSKEKEKTKLGTYAKHSGSKMLFTVPSDVVKFLKETDLRDRGLAMHTHGRTLASLIGAAAGNPTGVLMLASPYGSGQVHQLDPDKIKEVRLAFRTPFESRSFNFERVGKDKDKTWTEKSDLFAVDPEKMSQFIKEFAKLSTERIVAVTGGPRSEHKLGPKDFTMKLDLVQDDGSTVTLTVGTAYQQHGHYANSSYWPETVFMIPAGTIAPILEGASHFAKERPGTN